MKPLFIEAKKKFKDENINLKLLNELKGKTISLAATIQYIDLIPKVKTYLEKQGKKVIIKQGAHHEAHVLGCNSSALDKSADTILIITDGKFHAINNAIQIQKEIYIFDTENLTKIKKKEIELHKKKTLAKKKIFLSINTVGLLISTKPGQKNKTIEQIRKKIEKLKKKVYIFEGDTINPTELENFPQIKIWVNTSCPGLALDDKRIINLADILEFL
ncbi:MAG: diphthamide synthesis protein [archaeon]